MNYIDGLKIIGTIAFIVVCIALLIIWYAAFCYVAYVLLGMIGITGLCANYLWYCAWSVCCIASCYV